MPGCWTPQGYFDATGTQCAPLPSDDVAVTSSSEWGLGFATSSGGKKGGKGKNADPEISTRIDRQREKIKALKADLQAAEESGSATASQLKKLENQLADAEAALAQAEKRLSSAREEERTQLSGLAYGLGGAAGGAVAASLFGRGVVEGVAIGAVLGGAAYLFQNSRGGR